MVKTTVSPVAQVPPQPALSKVKKGLLKAVLLGVKSLLLVPVPTDPTVFPAQPKAVLLVKVTVQVCSIPPMLSRMTGEVLSL
ncbi:hypothetical protein WCLP8_2920001 [uncultured Gammaproteobacteria bacterium]